MIKTISPTEARRRLEESVTEEQVQQGILKALAAMGHMCLQTTHRIKLARCPKCGQCFRPGGNYGASKGIGDILVWHNSALWIALEAKRPSGPVRYSSPEQKQLAESGRIFDRALD